ncbi:hypothetical protein ACQPZJ_32755 [Actinoplanes sp. CA-054009]
MHGTLVEIRLTEGGRELFDRADRHVADLDAALASALTAGELKTLKELLSRVSEAARSAQL